MYLTEFWLKNYKSFLDSGAVSLGAGFNVLTGQNNVGKTALLEGLTLDFSSKPHRSSATVPTVAHTPDSASVAVFRFVVDAKEVEEFLKISSSLCFMPYPKAFAPGDKGQEVLRRVLEAGSLEVELEYRPNQRLRYGAEVSFNLYDVDRGRGWVSIPSKNQSGGYVHHGALTAGNMFWLGEALGRHFMSRIYGFRAERLNVGRSAAGVSRELAPDASNLPEVLSVLQGNPARFERYNKLVRQILPQIEWVTVRPVEGGKSVEILVWNENPRGEREDLAVPLAESGTGVGQVLAMMYLVVSSDFPRTIIIDEPNSFLHPGAVRALVEIFREHPQHQYVVSTHSPELIAASNPTAVYVLRKKGQTTVERVDSNEARQLRSLLLEIGSRFSDVFGAEGVLWVEGKTEELCFPLIVRKILRRSLVGVSIVGVLHTGDFDSEDARSVFRIYERLTQAHALLPPALAFIFDRELRSQRERDDLVRLSRNKVEFLSRRTYENYLLRPTALAAVLNDSGALGDKSVSEEDVQKWLEEHGSDVKYYVKAKTKDFLADVDAPKLLGDLFFEISDGKLEYDKVEHSIALTEWLLEREPSALEEIAKMLGARLPDASGKGAS